MAVTLLIYDATCPACGHAHTVKAQTALAVQEAPGFYELRVGDKVRLANLEERGFVSTGRVASEPLRVLDVGQTCGDEPLWTEIALTGDTISGLALVRCDRAVLDRVHFVGREIFHWATQLPDPGEWNEDVLFTRDPIRRLRTQLLLREPLPARNRDEVALFLDTIRCAPVGEMTPVDVDGRRLWKQPCTGQGGVRFDLMCALDGESPSKIVPADVFRRRADELVLAVPLYASDLDADGTRDARENLQRAIGFLEQLLAYVPAGQDHVPLDDFWGDDPRAVRVARPDRYARSRIEATLSRWRDDLAQLGSRPLRVVRSADEAALFMVLHPCPRCGRRFDGFASRIEAREGALVSVYAGPCPGCGLPRQFDLELDATMPPAVTDDEILLGEGLSTCLDPGQLLEAAELYGDAGNDRELQLAISALDEAIKFVPAGADAVPESSITSRGGWVLYDDDPRRFTRVELLAARQRYRESLTGERQITVEELELYLLSKMKSEKAERALEASVPDSNRRLEIVTRVENVFDRLGHPASEYATVLGPPLRTSAVQTTGAFKGSMRHEWALPRWPDVDFVVNADTNGMPWGVGFEGGRVDLPEDAASVEPWRWSAKRLRSLATGERVLEEWDDDLEIELTVGGKRFRAVFALGLLQSWQPA